MRWKFFILLFVLIFLIILPLTPASKVSDKLSDYSLEKTYGPEQNINGWIKINLTDESSNSVFSSNFDGEITLSDLLTENSIDCSSSSICNCIPADCEDDYKTIGAGEAKKTYSLNSNQEKIIGIKLIGIIDSITEFSFNISADNAKSCKKPLEIDILDDESVDWQATLVGEDYLCSEGSGMGCFSDGTEEVVIGSERYCEKIKLPAGKKYKIGAWLRGSNSMTLTPGLLEMELFSLGNEEEGSIEFCNINTAPSLSGEEVGCNIELEDENLQDREYYVCINVKEETEYKIKRENKEPCGFYGTVPPVQHSLDYSIFARKAKYEKIGNFVYDESEFVYQTSTDDLAEYIDSYLDWKYDKNCTNECIIPVKFITGSSINLEISNLILKYKETGITKNTTLIHELETDAAKISGSIVLDLEKTGIITPDDYGEHDFTLYLDNEELFEESINVEEIPVINNVVPRKVSAAVPTKFIAVVSYSKGRNISEYVWDFGDGKNYTTSENSIKYTYKNKGNYTLTLRVEDIEGFTAIREFTVNAESPKNVINTTITEYKARLNNLSFQLAAMPEWKRKEIEKLVGINSSNDKLKAIERDYRTASTEQKYIEIMTSLVEISIPNEIKASVKGNLPFFVNTEIIEPQYLADFGAGVYKSSEKSSFQKAISGWVEENLDLSLGFEYISAYYDDKTDNLLSSFNLQISSKTGSVKELYLVVNGKVVFSQQYTSKTFTDAIAIKLEDIKNKSIEFIIPYTEIENIELYLSPSFKDLIIVTPEPCNFNAECEKDLGEDWKNCKADCKPWGWVTILLIILLFLGFGAYIGLQFWYKTKYENYLFKNKNNLFNLINFIKNARNQGLSDYEIKSKLKGSGWSWEQISYVFKKTDGKAIMPFDFLKLLKKFERKRMMEPLPIPPMMAPGYPTAGPEYRAF